MKLIDELLATLPDGAGAGRTNWRLLDGGGGRCGSRVMGREPGGQFSADPPARGALSDDAQ
jgi:hypothetical protein